jgi:hypothetical protein
MGYTIGVSSGMWSIAKSQPNQSEQYLTWLRKVFWGAQRGVNFTQFDLETITEFDEPYIKESIQKIKQLGLRFGIHSETAATGAHTMILESALGDEYSRSHERFIAHLKGAGRVGSEYVLTHASEAMPLRLIGTQALQSTKIVDIWGRDIRDFLEDFPEILEWATDQEFIQGIAFGPYNLYDEQFYFDSLVRDFRKTSGGKDPSEEDKGRLKIQAKEEFKNARRQNIRDSSKRPSLSYGTERLAYALTAKWMEMNNDPLWNALVGKGKKFDEKMYLGWKWVPAVTAKYIWGHFHPLKKMRGKFSKNVPKFDDPKPILEEHDLVWLFEPEMGKPGWEKYMRLVSIPHIYQMVKAIGHTHVKVAIDFEHLLSAGEDPIGNIKQIPFGAGNEVYVIHVGWPTPHAPAHVPLYLGSEAQQYIYESLYLLKQRGWTDGIIIFERGGGDDPVKSSVISLRKIIKYLEKDTDPKKLPEDFFGLDPKGPAVARQKVNIQMHAYDPLAGLITQPEEEHGMIGKTAIDKGKGEQWKKEKYK